MRDTRPEVQLEYRRQIMAVEPGRRVAMTCEMFGTAKTLARAGILRDGPLPENEIRCRLFLRFHGRDFSEEEKVKILGYFRAEQDSL